MRTQLEKLVAEAMTMTAVDRAAFAQVLLESLGPAVEYDEAWELEIERRLSDIDKGIKKLIPIDDALAQVRSMLK